MLQKIYTVTITALVLAVVPVVSQAQTINMSDALARMNSIIEEMEKLRAEFQTLSTSVSQSQTTTATPAPAVLGAQTSAAVFSERLEFGETNDDIKRIQKLLATDPEIYPYGVASGFFGPKTEEAIKNLQARNGWDTPGVVGPATRALLEDYFRAYPDENWPADVLKSAPPEAKVLGDSTTDVQQQLADAMQALATAQSQQTTIQTTGSNGSNLADEINVEFGDDEALVEIIYTNGNRKGLVVDSDDEDDVIEYIASRTVLTEAMVREVIDFDGRSSSRNNDDGDDAEDAIDAADKAIDDADEEIEEADDDGDDVDWAEDTLRDAKRKLEKAEEAFEDEDFEDAIELAEEAEELAEDAEDRIDEEEDDDRDSDEIDEINVEIGDGESEVEVEYEDGDDLKFDVDEDDEEDIIEAIAKKLDIDEEDVEDLVEFDYGDVDSIEVRIDEDSALVRVFYDAGAEERLRPDLTDEEDIIEYVADKLDMDEDEVEDIIDFS